MQPINQITEIIILLIFIYAMVIIPKSIGEIKGIYMETPDPFFGKFEADCKWKHGPTYLIGAISYIIIIPVLIITFKEIMENIGVNTAIIIMIIILLIFKTYYDKQRPVNEEKAYQKNLAEGLITSKQKPKIKQGITQKIIKKIIKN